MSDAPSHIELEVERAEVLARILERARKGEPPGDEATTKLKALQGTIMSARSDSPLWTAIADHDQTGLASDVFAMVLAPELAPRLGWLFQSLQPNGGPPHASRALLQELLALGPDDWLTLTDATGRDGVLRRMGLIMVDDEAPYSAIRPSSDAVGRLFGRPGEGPPPPGTHRIVGRADWDSLVLPADRKQQLREFLAWIVQRPTVVGEWGGRMVGGPIALFSGPSGTGKTYAATVLATALGWPLYRVDLGRLVSKYIGETEKNLNRLFDGAHGRPMVLQFDEADSLFSRRGEVREARDRYANLEVSHLLARIESHDGPCILTTNLRGQIDPAFARRFQVVVNFPRPEPPARVELWRRLLPVRAPLDPMVEPEMLANAVALSGGAIANAALQAAYLAAAEGEPIGLPHIALAVWRERGKFDPSCRPDDLGPLRAHLPEEVCQ